MDELENAGQTFFYSTKTGEQNVPMRHGIHISGAMHHDEMHDFCHKHNIRLLIDAAHPFAQHLHNTVATVAREMNLPAIRYERIFPKQYDKRIEWCNDYEDVVRRVEQMGEVSFLSTAGVNSISKLNTLSQAKVSFRILKRESSIDMAHQQGIHDSQLCFYENESDAQLFQRLKPDVVLVKDSGASGGFEEKVSLALGMGIKVLALRRPDTPSVFSRVNGPHGLRREVERLAPDFFPLRSGLTTGTYATACALAGAMRLVNGEQPRTVGVLMPNGETIHVGVEYADNYVFSFKDAGDDPDVTDGLEIRATVEYVENSGNAIIITGGEGVGTVTLPGFDSPIGEAAINKVPQEMIRRNILEQLKPEKTLKVTVSVPDGERVAQRTFNPRLGIVGGISIVGVSGIVKPFSEESFVASIKKCVQVAKASGSKRIVINSGAKSERFVKNIYPELPPQAFVEYGNYIGETIKIAAQAGFERLTLGIMLGKAVKLAAGNLDTHSRKATMDKAFIACILKNIGCKPSVVKRAEDINLARELWNIVPTTHLQRFVDAIIECCETYCQPLLPNGEITILLINEEGHVLKHTGK